MHKRTILIIDDSKVNRIILSKILCEDYTILQAENGQAALDLMKDYIGPIAGIMLDLVMPIMNGFEFLDIATKDASYKNIPIIVSTGNGDEENEVKALEHGAWDFVSKPYKPKIIKFRLKNAIDRSQLAAFEQLKYLAEYDTLTGIFNKSKFCTQTHELLESNPEKSFVLIRFDIDRFQLINSFYGREQGDLLLKQLANLLKELSQKFLLSTYGRMEADIFAFCIPFVSKDNILAVIHHLTQSLKSFNLNFDIVPTYGVYIINDNFESVDSILDKSALAAKSIKGDYIHGYAFYNQKMSRTIETEQRITNEMNTALNEEQFVVYLQPKYSLITNTPAGAEALVRWIHPERGLVSPGDFIPVFERNGFISQLDYYVWEKVCKLLKKWIDMGLNPFPVSVNVSRVDIYNPNLLEMICELTNRYQVPHKLLNLELTESAYTDNPQAMKETMKAFHEKGFLLFMDDFGSGYSSLNILKEIPVDVLKIDMRFLSGADIEGRGETIIAAVVRMAKWLQIPTIAEGIEQAEQADFLRDIGCEYAQGFFYAKPMPVEDYEALIQKNETFIQPETNNFDVNSLWVSDPHMENLFSNVPQAVGIYEYTENHVELLRVNNAFHEQFGFSDMSVSNNNTLESIHPNYRNIVVEAFNQATNSKDIAECDYLRQNGNNQPIWVHLSLKYITKIGNKHILFGSLIDISTQKEIDMELQKYRTALSSKKTASGNLLIVDDVEMNREIIKEIFYGKYQVLEAANGKEALEVLKKYNNQVDLILLDIMMPVMNGTQFLEYKQTIKEIANIPVIIITADDTPQQQINTLSLGVNDYVVKPFIPEIVQRRVKNVLESTKRFQEKIKESTTISYETDSNTGFYTKNCMELLVNSTLNKNTNQQHAFIVIHLPINDNTDEFNKIALKIRDYFRRIDMFGNLNNSKLCIFMTDIPSSDLVIHKCSGLCELINDYLKSLGTQNIQLCTYGYSLSSKLISTFDDLYEKANENLAE